MYALAPPFGATARHIRVPPAHRLPPELISFIVKYLPYGKDGRVRKSGIANASMTCRYWAKILRPPLFHELTLRTPEDVNTLLEIFGRYHGGFTSLFAHVHKIIYHKTDNRIPPWLRLRQISQVAPQAKFHCIVAQSHLDVGAKSIDGDTLIHCLPRTLPCASFPPMVRFELRDVEFTHPTRFVKFAHTFSRTEKWVCASVTFKTPGGVSDLSRNVMPERVQRSRYIRSVGVDIQDDKPAIDFVLQLRLMFVVMNIHGVSSHTDGVWTALETAIGALIPPNEVWVGDGRVEMAHSQFFSISAVRAEETERITFEARVYPCGGSRVKIDTSKASEIPMSEKAWGEFEEILAKLDHSPSLEVVIGENESMIESVLQGYVLSGAADSGKLHLRSANRVENPGVPGAFTREQVLAVPERQYIDGGVVKLTGAERLQLLDSQDKDEYLHGLKTLRQRTDHMDSLSLSTST